MLEQACKKAGGASKLATLIDATPQQLSNWRARGIPEEFCAPIERATGIPCEELRTDIPWLRVPDKAWLWHEQGRPVIDVTRTA